MSKILPSFKAAFPHTLPVMAGYLFLGAAFGMMLESRGYGPLWALLMSAAIYAGALQFVAVGIMVSAFSPLNVFLLSLLVNARHLFYGISLLQRCRGLGWKRIGIAFWLTDETFSLLCSTKAPPDADDGWFMFFIAGLNHCYWIAGGVIGSVMGQLLKFNNQGLDFVMTALFVVIFINQWQATPKHRPAIIGLAATALCLALFGRNYFILPSMCLIVLALTCIRNSEKAGVNGTIPGRTNESDHITPGP